MACVQLGKFAYATEHLGQTIYKQAKYRSLWMNVPQKGTYPLNVGSIITSYGVKPIEPTDDSGQWAPIAVSDETTDRDGFSNVTSTITSQEGNAPTYTTLSENTEGGAIPLADTTKLCFNHWQDVKWGYITIKYGPEMSLLRGPEVCERELILSHNVEQFISTYVEAMKNRAQRQWEDCFAYHHRRLSAKAICGSDFEAQILNQDSLTTTTTATSQLTQDHLDWLATLLMEDGATNPDGNGFITWDQGPVFTLNIGAYQSKALMKASSGFRTDINYAKPEYLIGRLGANVILGNFRHVIDQRPRRYTHSGSAYVPVPYYAATTSTVSTGPDQFTLGAGTVYYQNPDYRTAEYEGADIICPYLFTSESVNAPSSAGGLSLGGADYAGNWEWKTGAYKWRGAETTYQNCMVGGDPLDQIGRHFAQFMHAPNPNPIARHRWGYHIIYRRCLGNNFPRSTCSS